MPSFAPKVMSDGRAMLNIGCGWKMHHAWTNLDFSPYAKLVSRPWLVRLLKQAGVLSPLRLQRLALVDPQIVCWDLRKGIPYADDTFDVVYHSHFLEHLDRTVAPIVLKECKRVLKPRGVIRVVVPDWEYLTQRYLDSLAAWDFGNPNAPEMHSQAMHDLIDQMVRSDATGASKGSFFGKIENLYRGGAAGTGELHRWMYDRRSMGALLKSVGFQEGRVERAKTSRIGGWVDFALDLGDDGKDYKPESLYVEAVK